MKKAMSGRVWILHLVCWVGYFFNSINICSIQGKVWPWNETSKATSFSRISDKALVSDQEALTEQSGSFYIIIHLRFKFPKN